MMTFSNKTSLKTNNSLGMKKEKGGNGGGGQEMEKKKNGRGRA